MAVTYRPIATVTVTGSSASTISFTNIPGTYTDLVIQASLRSTRSGFPRAPLTLTFNSITSGYNWRDIYGVAAGVQNATGSGAYTQIGNMTSVNGTSNVFTPVTIYIPNYASTTLEKVIRTDTAQTNISDTWIREHLVTYLSNTAAITTITLADAIQSSSFVVNSTASLYGISKS
jgi:hypothetical protein